MTDINSKHISKLEKRLEIHNQRMELLKKLSDIVNEPVQLENMLNLIIPYLVRDIDGVGGGIYLLDRDYFKKPCAASIYLPDEFLDRIEEESKKKSIRFDQSNYAAVHYHDFDAWDDLSETPYMILKNQGIRGFISIALQARDNFLGYVHIYTRKKRKINNELSQLYTHIGKYIGLSVENRKLQLELEHRINENSSFYETSKLLISTLDYDMLIERVVWIMHEDLGAKYCSVLLLDKSKNELYIKAAIGFTEQAMRERLKVGFQGITGWVAKHGKPLIVPDVTQDPRYIKVSDLIRSELAVPMIAEGEVIGVLEVASEEYDHFNKQGLRFMTLLAQQVALAIERSQLHQKIREQAITDRLTGLLNRQYLEDYLKTEAVYFIKQGINVGLVMVDLNHLKEINDNHGHVEGDYILRKTAQFLKTMFPEEPVCRWGGDEFIIVMIGRKLEDLDRRLQQVKENTTKWSRENKIRYPIEVALGYAVAKSEKDLKGLVDYADKRMYEDKRLGNKSTEVK
ncbi:diguanylate cyclase [bacterium]|nr:diguanylate cyclase [bacterium]